MMYQGDERAIVETFSKVDSLFSPALANRYTLTFLMAEDQVHLAVLDTERQMYLGVKQYDVPAKVFYENPSFYERLLETESWFGLPFKQTNIAYLFQNNIFVPSVFAESIDHSLLVKNHFVLASNATLEKFSFARIDAINLMAIPTTAKAWAKAISAKRTELSLAVCFLQKAFQDTDFNVHVWFGKSHFLLAIFNQKELQFINTIHYRTAEEAAYFLLFALQQNGVDTHSAKAIVGGAIVEGDELFGLLRKYIFKVETSTKVAGFYFAPALQSLPSQQFELLYFINHCV